ncbi:hypothetical protein SAMN06265171_105251 [Chryseobacterium rhizoplanae]|uniref:Signal transducing protein n=1 Tax=Chryseobacterium rhizoplanae TaxID=1609531 RepID=A0A521DNH1_9FLAO|nr:hypothetical protein [Chryseobacterium rhizoplanae]SMO72611.1 hypothetical protein SAMN06265171_105251 [Chryseobacterium rhizoplanae]
MSRLISIKFYRQISNAREDKQLLEKNGINCFIGNENLFNADWMLSKTGGGIQLQVFDVDVEDAIHILEKEHTEDPKIGIEVSNPVCTRCGSHHVFQIEKLGGVFGMSWYILGFPSEISKTYYYCYYCDGEFTC